MEKNVKEAYELLGFTEEKPSNSGKYICVCGESDYQPYQATVCIGAGLVKDSHLGATDLNAYHDNLVDLMYKRISD